MRPSASSSPVWKCSRYEVRKLKVESRKEGRSDSAAMATHRIEWLRLGLIPVQILLSGRQVLVCIIHREQRHLQVSVYELIGLKVLVILGVGELFSHLEPTSPKEKLQQCGERHEHVHVPQGWRGLSAWLPEAPEVFQPPFLALQTGGQSGKG